MMKKRVGYFTNLWYAIINKKYNRECDNMSNINTRIEKKANDILLKNDMLKLPVDLIKIAKNNDIEVYATSLPNDISGSIKYNEEKQKFQILIEESDSYDQQKFTLAHELAHFFLERDTLLNNQEIHFDTKYRKYGNIEEEVDDLASAILMNEIMLRRLFDVCPHIPSLARAFEVSESDMTVRLTKLGLL